MNEPFQTRQSAIGLAEGVEAPAHEMRASRGRVLVVEDEYGLAEVLALHLEGAGFEAVVCHTGLAALYELDRGRFDLVLLDLTLPEVSGFRLMQLLKQRTDHPGLAVMVITALSFQEAEEAARAGADDFITKPFVPEEVLTRVERLLSRVR